MPFGLSATGFTKKLFIDVQTSVVTAIRSVPGMARLNLGRDAFLGNVVAAAAAAVAEVWDVAADLYASWDPDTATGLALDNLCAITGTRRRPASATVVTCTVNVDAGTYPAGALIATRVGLPAVQYVNAGAITNAGPNPADVTGVVFRCTSLGPNACPAGTLTVIASSYPGWNSITNPGDGTAGKALETDQELRLRREAEIASGGGSTADALVDAFRADTRVRQCFSFSNDLDTAVSGPPAMPPHSMLAVVYDDSLMTDAEIATLVWAQKPNGVRTIGDTSASTLDRNGQSQTVSFSRPVVRSVYLVVTVAPGVGWDGTRTPAAIRTALADFGAATYQMGADVLRSFLFAPVTGVAGVGDVVDIQLGFTPSPVDHANLTIGILELARLDTSRITVATA